MQVVLLSVLISTFISCSTLPEQGGNRLLPSNLTVASTETSKEDSCKNTATSFNCVKVVSVYDGDSFFIDLPNEHPLFGKRMGVRVSGIDTPEMKTKDSCEKKKAIAAKALLEKLFKSAKRIYIVDAKKDKYFRILGTVQADGKDVAQELINAKLGYSYHGEKKPKRNWCK